VWAVTINRSLTAKEAAAMLGLAPATLYTPGWRQRHGLRAVKIGSALRFRERDLADFLRRCREAAPAETAVR
jgi:excisionase family DNA binding protein